MDNVGNTGKTARDPLIDVYLEMERILTGELSYPVVFDKPDPVFLKKNLPCVNISLKDSNIRYTVSPNNPVYMKSIAGGGGRYLIVDETFKIDFSVRVGVYDETPEKSRVRVVDIMARFLTPDGIRVNDGRYDDYYPVLLGEPPQSPVLGAAGYESSFVLKVRARQLEYRETKAISNIRIRVV